MADLVLSFRGEQVNVVKNINTILVKLTQLEKKLAGVTATSRTASTSLATMGKRAMTSMLRVGRAMARLTTMLGMGGLAGSFIIATKKAKEFETAMAEVGTLIIKDDGSIEKYKKAIRELAKESSFTAAELSKGLYQVISAGVKGTEDAAGSMELLNVAQHAAVAGVSGVFESVDVLTTSLNAYGLSTEQAEHFSDVLFTSVRLGKTTFNELASQMGTVASVASVAGISFEEVNAAIVALTKAGLGTDLATTQLKQTIVSFLKPTEALKAALGDPAKALKERGLVGAMQAVKDYAQGDAAALTKLIPNIRAFNSVAILAGKGAEGFKEALEEMQNVTGATETAYAKMADTFAFKSKKLWNKISDTLISIGDELMPILLRSLEGFSEWVDNNKDEIVKFFKNLVVYIGATISAIKEVIKFAIEGVKAILDLGKKAKDIVNAPFFGKSNAEIIKQKRKELKAIAPVATWGKTIIAQPEFGESKRGAVEDDPLSRSELGAPAAAKARRDAMKNKLSKEEIDKWLAEKKEAMDVLHQLELLNMDKLQRLQAKYDDDAAKILNMKYFQQKKNAEKLEKTLRLLRQEFEKSRAKAIGELNDKRLEGVRKVKELEERKIALQDEANRRNVQALKDAAKEVKKAVAAYEKYLRAAGRGAEKAGEEYKERRADWGEKAFEKWGKGQQMLEGESYEAYSKRLEEIGEGSWADKAIETFQKRWEQVQEGFWTSVGNKLFDILESGIDLLLSPLSKVFEPIMGAIMGGSMEDTQAAVDQTVEFFTQLAENLGPILGYLLEEGVPKMIDAIIGALPAIFEAIFTYLPALIGKIAAMIPKLITILISKLPLIISSVISMIPLVINAIIAGIPRIIGEFVAQIPMIAYALAKAVVDAIFSLVPGLGKKKKGGGKKGGGVMDGIGTNENPIVTKEKQEVSVAAGNVEPMDPTYLAALKVNFEDMMRRGPSEGQTKEEYKARLSQMNKLLKEQGVKTGWSFHKGGFVGRIKKAIKAHTGMFVMPKMAEDDRLILAQTGEGILNRQATANVGGEAGINAMNAGGGGGSTVNNFIWAPEHAFVEDSGKVIDEMQADMINKRAGKVQKLVNNRVAGFKTRK